MVTFFFNAWHEAFGPSSSGFVAAWTEFRVMQVVPNSPADIAGSLNADWNLRLQYLAGMSLNTYKGPAILSEILKYCRFPSDVFVGSEVYVEAMKQRLAAAGRH
jgi:hypothetical protein